MGVDREAMSPADFLAETPDVSRPWCPGCEPERDPLKEVLVERRCRMHASEPQGLDDGGVTVRGIGFGTGVDGAEGTDCQAVADLVRRRT